MSFFIFKKIKKYFVKFVDEDSIFMLILLIGNTNCWVLAYFHLERRLDIMKKKDLLISFLILIIILLIVSLLTFIIKK